MADIKECDKCKTHYKQTGIYMELKILKSNHCINILPDKLDLCNNCTEEFRILLTNWMAPKKDPLFI